MNVLIVGSSEKSGAWQMRGVQLGNAIGARVTTAPSDYDWRWADVAVLVKRSGHYAGTAHRFGIPVVWDALDFWGQPFDNPKKEDDARLLLERSMAGIGPVVTIGATEAMADAAGNLSAYLPHHSWRGLVPATVRDKVEVVGYQGNPVFLGRWRSALITACERRGWKFVAIDQGQKDIWVADILVALRDEPWDGWMCREWKSGVKLVNAIAAGRPVITQPSAAAREIGPPGVVVESPSQIEQALDLLSVHEARQAAYDACRTMAPAYQLPAIAERFRGILTRTGAACATT